MIKRFHLTIRSSRKGQAAAEFAFMFPVFIAVFIGLASFSLLFYSYVTMQLAVREGAGALIRNPQLTIYAVRNTVCTNSFSLDKSQLLIKVEPPDGAGTAGANCASLNASEGAYLYWTAGIPVKVTAFYTVPLPRVSIPTMSSGRNAVILGPFQIQAFSLMTLE